ncbi:uncharacterized protein LOC130962959 [Arachis stenosperma]|uniref:uncharacterized protein LOC130962959 n=1 Tax=Arachis stenosperma TaxID=217475 RepID=UPI0025AB8758|nr:uncharacterized protein LOC130962959 [Arachis stenosperma]
MEANATVTLQVVQRSIQPAGSGNENGEGAEDSLRGVPRTLAVFGRLTRQFSMVRQTILKQTTVGEAQQWWQEKCLLLDQQNVNITWALFEEVFYRKYFYESLGKARELELLQLKQGSMTIAEYTSKFEEFFRFSRISQGTPESYEEWKCIRYEVGLREDNLACCGSTEDEEIF